MNNVISTKVNIFRNVKDYKFTPKLEEAKQNEIVDKLAIALKDKLSLLNLTSTDVNVQNALKNAGLINHPKCPNVFVSEKINTSITLFECEHITITSVGEGYDKSTFTNACDIAKTLANKISLSYNDNYGYLMSDLSKVGAGVNIECVVDLNAINSLGKIEQVKQNIRKLGYQLKPTQDKNLFVLSTICNLGFTENEIFDEFDKMVNKLQDLEIESSKMLDVANHDEILDASLRSLAILKSAYLLNYDELKAHLSNLRTALNLGLLNIGLTTINKLQTLSNKTGEFVSKSELINLAKQTQNLLKGEKDV